MEESNTKQNGIYINFQSDLSDINERMKLNYNNEQQRKLNQQMEAEHKRQSPITIASLISNPAFMNNPIEYAMQHAKQHRRNMTRKFPKHTKSGLKYTLDRKQDGACQHVLIKSDCPTLKFSKIHLAIAETLQKHPASIGYHLFIRGWAPHICINCSLNILIITNNLETISKWLMKYRKYYYQKIKQRPLKVTNDLINTMEISSITLQLFSHIKIMKFFLANKSRFKRMFTILHCLADFWIALSMVEQNVYELQNVGITNFNVRFEQFIECNEFFLELFYSSFLQKVKLFKINHVKWYLELGKKGEYFVKYGVNGCTGTASQHEYKYNMYSIFGKILVRKCCEFPKLICRHLKMNIKSIEFMQIALQNKMRWQVTQPKLVMQRMNQCFYVHYRTWYCNNIKCNITYFQHMYQNEYEKLLDKRNKYGIVHKKYKTNNKWYLCKDCRLVSYCSRKCQKHDWKKSHKAICNSICG